MFFNMKSISTTALVFSISFLLSLPTFVTASPIRRDSLEGVESYKNAKNLAAMSSPTPPYSKLAHLKAQTPSFKFNMTTQLPSSSIIESVMLDPVPSQCDVNVGFGDKAECKATMTAFSVTFDDCGDSWTVCRCSDAQMDIPTINERLSRVPVGLRRYVNTVFVMNEEAPRGYALTNGDIHIFGDCGAQCWIHEATHTFDYATASPVSSSPEWHAALREDTCGPNDYALKNRVEDFAEVTLLKIYQMTHDGELPPGISEECMQHQLDFFDDIPLFDPDTMFGNTCNIEADDPNLGARKTQAPKVLPKKIVLPLPGYDDVVNNVAATMDPEEDSEHEESDTSSSAGPSPASTPKSKRKGYKNAGISPSSSMWLASFSVLIGFLLAWL